MQTIECIKTRRSRRKFLDKIIFDEVIRDLIDVARHAPFGGPPIKDCQPWEFIVVKDSKTKADLALHYDDRQFVRQASVLIAICIDTAKDKKYQEYEAVAGLTAENILLAAHAQGLGACYVTAFLHHAEHAEDRKVFRQALSLPGNIMLVAILAIGYPDPSEKLEPKKLRNIKEITHLEKW